MSIPTKNLDGGFKEGNPYSTDKHRIWTNYFLKNIKKSDFETNNILSAPPNGKKRFLYVIDMQKDFIDRAYIENNKSQFGKFAVGDGESVIEPIVEYVRAALDNSDYENVIFSRDYHPANHCSFAVPNMGSFPAHCIQGTKGAEIIPEMMQFAGNPKTIVVFKGMVQNVDSFSAYKFNSKQRSSGPNCNGCEQNGENCSNAGTGGYTLKPEIGNGWNYNGNLTVGEANQFNPGCKEGDVIEICGLAGDYCVRDTAIALKTAYPNCEVVVLNDLVRYPFLPICIPITQHRNLETGVDDHIKNFRRFLSNEKNKGLNDYLFDSNKSLISSENLPLIDALEADLKNFDPVQGKFGENGKYYHFISDPRALIEDYKNAGVKMVIKPIEGGRRRKSQKRKSQKRKSQKRKSQKRRSRRHRRHRK